MRYVEARIEENDREEAYRVFVTRSLQLAPQGMYIEKNYIDFLDPVESAKREDTRTGEEIALDIIKKAGLNFDKREKHECI